MMNETRLKVLTGLAAAVGILLIFAGVFLHPLLSIAGNGASVGTSEPPSVEMQRSIDEKQLMAGRAEALQAAGQGERAPRDPLNMPAFSVEPMAPFRSGILENEPGPFYSGDFVTGNAWQDRSGEGFIQVFAGVSGQDLSQGVVVVLIHQPDLRQVQELWHPVPDKTGSVLITGLEGSALVLEAAGGENYLFDTETFEFR